MFRSYSHYNKDSPGCKRSDFPFFTDFRKSLSTFILTNPLKRSTLDITCIVNFLSIYSGGYYRERIQQFKIRCGERDRRSYHLKTSSIKCIKQ